MTPLSPSRVAALMGTATAKRSHEAVARRLFRTGYTKKAIAEKLGITLTDVQEAISGHVFNVRDTKAARKYRLRSSTGRAPLLYSTTAP